MTPEGEIDSRTEATREREPRIRTGATVVATIEESIEMQTEGKCRVLRTKCL